MRVLIFLLTFPFFSVISPCPESLPLSLSLREQYEQILDTAPTTTWCIRLQEVYDDTFTKNLSKEMAKTLSAFTKEVADAQDLTPEFKNDLKQFHDRVRQKIATRGWSWKTKAGIGAAVLGGSAILWWAKKRRDAARKHSHNQLVLAAQHRQRVLLRRWRDTVRQRGQQRRILHQWRDTARRRAAYRNRIDSLWYSPRLQRLQAQNKRAEEQLATARDLLDKNRARWQELQQRMKEVSGGYAQAVKHAPLNTTECEEYAWLSKAMPDARTALCQNVIRRALFKAQHRELRDRAVQMGLH